MRLRRLAGAQNTLKAADTPQRISVALLTGLAFIPLVVVTGLMTDRSPVDELPAAIGLASLRGAFDDAVVSSAPLSTLLRH